MVVVKLKKLQFQPDIYLVKLKFHWDRKDCDMLEGVLQQVIDDNQVKVIVANDIECDDLILHYQSNNGNSGGDGYGAYLQEKL